jgi:DNA polymerase alpha subunit A
MDCVETVGVLAPQNSRRFGVVAASVDKYLERCGRRWVSMQSIFAFAVSATGV